MRDIYYFILNLILIFFSLRYFKNYYFNLFKNHSSLLTILLHSISHDNKHVLATS